MESRCEMSAIITLYFLNHKNDHTCDLNTNLIDYNKLFQSCILYHHDIVICTDTLNPDPESTCEESATVSLSQGYVYTCEHN